jgi:periplasmic divalent cation tolerance protein
MFMRSPGLHAKAASAPARTHVHWRKKLAMTDAAPPVRLVLTTCASPGEASRLARTLVEEHLAACATLIPAVQSIYHWEGQIEFSTETLLLLKTGPEQLDALETRLHQLHSYQTPEFLVLGVEGVSHRYLEWLQASLRQA